MPRKQVGNFVLLERLGRGAYGKYWKGYNAVGSGELVFVRAVRRKRDEDVRRLKHEAQFLQRLSHANVAAFRDLTKTVSHLYLFSEYCPGTLAGLLRATEPLSKVTAWRYCAQLASGLRAIHQTADAAHCDLRPRNILIEGSPADAQLKISNFAFGMRVPATCYTAPEVLSGQPATMAADIWSIGVIYLQLLSGVRPGRGRPPHAETLAAQSGTEGQQELLLALLRRSPEQRPGSDQLEERVAAVAESERAKPQVLVPRDLAGGGWATTGGVQDAFRGFAFRLSDASAAWLAWARRPLSVDNSPVAIASPATTAARVVGPLLCALRLGRLASDLFRDPSGAGASKPKRPPLPCVRGGPTRETKDPLTFVVGQLQTSHLFRLRTAQLFPRVLYSV